MESWSVNDHFRHFMYQSIYNHLKYLPWDNVSYDVLDFGSKWFGDPDGGWQTNMRWMFKDILGSKMNHILATYPEYNAEDLLVCPDNSLDIIVADQVLEHVQRPWLAAEAFYRVLKPNGICIVATPGLYPIHKSPLDCWRIMPDGYNVLFPDGMWAKIVFDMWGSAERVGFEFAHNKELISGGPTYTVEDAMDQPGYVSGHDNYCPIQLWWIGRKLP